MNEGNNYKAKISTARGEFEFEGNRDFVEKQIEKILEIEKTAPAPTIPVQPENVALTKKTKKSSVGSVRKSASEQPKILSNLVPKDKISDLKSFFNKKKPDSHIENYAVLMYWSKENLNLTETSIHEMWTLYRVLGIRPPRVPIQTFRDGKSKRSYFESSNDGKYMLTSIGETFVEHDLPRAPKDK